MTEKIEKIVDVTISRETQTISRQGFGTPLILGPNGTFTVNTTREYSSIDGVAADFATTDDEYLAAQAIFSQQPRVSKLKIATRAAPVAMVMTLVFSADIITGNSIDVDVDGVTITQAFTVGNPETLTALAAKIQAEPGVATAVSDGVHTITVTAAVAGVPFEMENCVVTGGLTQATGTITTTVDNVGVTEDLNAIVLDDNDWYGLILTSRTEAEVLQAAAWTETQYKIFFTASQDADIYDDASTTDIAYLLKDQEYDRTACIFNEDNDDYADAAWMGRGLPYDPGSITWMFKSLSGVSASDTLTETEITSIKDKNCNLYTKVANLSMMEWGWMVGGEWIDVMHGVDWIRARMQEEIFNKLVNAKKIPYTDSGIAIIEAQIRAVLENAMKKGVIAAAPELFDGQDYIVEAPKVADISDVDKGNRLLPDVTWQARLAGAIHKVVVQGRVQV